MFQLKTVDDLWGHIAYVLAYAPNFPHRDFLAADQQMTLERAFEQLRQGVLVAYPEESLQAKRAKLFEILDQSYAAYIKADEIKAGNLLNDFQDSIFKAT